MPQFPREVIFLEEIKRVVFSRRRLVALLLLAALCLVNLVRISPRRNTGISQVKTEQFLKAHQGESLEELQTQLDRILESPNCSLSDRMSYGLLRNQVEYLLGFPGRLAEIQAQAEHMSSVSIFAGSPYSQANIRKTAADYRRLEGAEVTLGHDRAVEQVMGASLSDWLLGAYMALVVASFLEERKRGLWTMVCASPAGRLGLPVWRLGAVALGALLGSAVLTCTELSHAYWMYGGLSELGRVLQSVSSFQDFTYPMTIGSFWLLYLLLRALGAFLLGLTLWFLQEAIADRRLVGAVWVLVLGGEYALYRRLPGTALLQKVNLFSCLHLRALVTGYCNLNLFGHPVGQLPLVLWAGLLLGALMLPGIGCIYRFRKPVSGYGWVNRLLDRVRRLFAPMARHASLLGHELYKTLAVGRGGLILLGALALAALLAQSPTLGTSDPVEVNLESYYRQSQGPVGQETWDYLAKRQARLAEQQAQWEELQRRYEAGEASDGTYEIGVMNHGELQAQALALDQYQTHVEALATQPGSYVLPHWVYRELLSQDSDRSKSLFLVCLLTLALLFGTQAGVERRTGMARVCQATPRGRGMLRRRRHGAAWILTSAFSVSVWSVQLIQLARSYGTLPYPQAPACCLTFLEDLPGGISILGLWLLLTLARTLSLCIWSSLILGATEKLGKRG